MSVKLCWLKFSVQILRSLRGNPENKSPANLSLWNVGSFLPWVINSMLSKIYCFLCKWPVWYPPPDDRSIDLPFIPIRSLAVANHQILTESTRLWNEDRSSRPSAAAAAYLCRCSKMGHQDWSLRKLRWGSTYQQTQRGCSNYLPKPIAASANANASMVYIYRR